MMATDLMRALDATVMAREAGMQPDEWQAKLLLEKPRRALLNCSRQSGKTECGIMLALHTALFESPALVVVVSPSQRQSSEFFRRVMLAYQRLEDVPELVAESALRAEFKNGSRILALPGTEKTVRGIAGASLIVVDEAARIEDALISAIRPMMATKSDARLIALSTPAGRRGWFFETWHGDGDWTRVCVPASECPRISPEFLAEELKELGPLRFSEEYELQFLDDETQVFPSTIIDAAFTAEVQPLWA